MAKTYALSTHYSTGGSLCQSWTFYFCRVGTSLDQMENRPPAKDFSSDAMEYLPTMELLCKRWPQTLPIRAIDINLYNVDIWVVLLPTNAHVSLGDTIKQLGLLNSNFHNAHHTLGLLSGKVV